jgi:hypothetical protein
MLCLFCRHAGIDDAFQASNFVGDNLKFSPDFLFNFKWAKGCEVKSHILLAHVFINRT